MRLEVATALKRNIHVVPVLVDGASPPSPEDLVELGSHNAIEISHDHFHSDMARLIESFRRRRSFSYPHAMPLSFYSQDLYRDVARNWPGRGLAYLFLVLALCWAPVQLIRFQSEIEEGVNSFPPSIFPQIPRFEINDGLASTDVTTPYFIRDPQNRIVAIIDMTGRYSGNELANLAYPVFVFTKTHWIFIDEDGRIEQDKYEKFDFWMDGPRLKRLLAGAKDWLALLSYPVVLLVVFIYRLIHIHIWAVIGKIISNILNIQLRYSIIVRLAAVAMTPEIFMHAISDLFKRPFPIPPLYFGFAITGAYLFFAIRANAKRVEEK